MIIYELIYYWDDTCYGPDITETVLLVDVNKVGERINKFTAENKSSNPISANEGVKLRKYTGQWYTYEYKDGSSNLEIRKHFI